jgi:predicted DNA-binding protein
VSNCILGVRIAPEDKELLKKVSKTRGEDLSDFVRRAIKKELASLSFLPDYDKKCLGVQVAKRE